MGGNGSNLISSAACARLFAVVRNASRLTMVKKNLGITVLWLKEEPAHQGGGVYCPGWHTSRALPIWGGGFPSIQNPATAFGTSYSASQRGCRGGGVGNGVIRMRRSSTTENCPIQSSRLLSTSAIFSARASEDEAAIRNNTTPHDAASPGERPTHQNPCQT